MISGEAQTTEVHGGKVGRSGRREGIRVCDQVQILSQSRTHGSPASSLDAKCENRELWRQWPFKRAGHEVDGSSKGAPVGGPCATGGGESRLQAVGSSEHN